MIFKGLLISLLFPLFLCQFFSREDNKNAPRMGRRSDPSMERDPRSMINNDSMIQAVYSLDPDQDSARLRKLASNKIISALLGLGPSSQHANNGYYPWMLMGGIDRNGQSDDNDPGFH